jgi:hypothetical protein
MLYYALREAYALTAVTMLCDTITKLYAVVQVFYGALV